MAVATEQFPRTRGWQAGLRLGFRAEHARTVLAERRRIGPLAVQRPFYPEGEVCHVYVLHPPGGVVGGDRLDIEVSAEPGARALLTTPGATKFYRSAGERARQVQHIQVGAGGSIEWLPQENIFFPGAEVGLETRVDLEGDARLALWEIHCLGRPAIREAFDKGHVDSRLSILRDGQPLLLERLRVAPDNRGQLSLMAGLAVAGMLVISGADEQALEDCRGLLTNRGSDYVAATLVDGLLVVRYLGNSTERARRWFTDVWTRLRQQTIGQQASMPRIWAT